MFQTLLNGPIPVAKGGVRLFSDLDPTAALNTVPDALRTVITEKAERWLTYDFPVIPMSRYMETRRTGARYSYEILLVDRWMALFDLCCAELIEKKGRYIDKIMDCIWMDCEMSTWTIQSHTDYILPAVDGQSSDWLELFSGELGTVISLAYYFFRDEFEKRAPGVFNARVEYEVRRRMLDNFMDNAVAGDKRWRWFQGGGNWNIWIMSNLLIVGSIFATDADELERIVRKVLSSAQVYLDTFPKDGVCPEGPRYWILSCGSFIDTIELLYDITDGAVDYTHHPLLRTMLEYMMYFIKPGTVTFNFGDAEICLAADELFLRRFARRIGYSEMERYAASLYKDPTSSYLRLTGNFYRKFRDLLCSAITVEPAEAYAPPYPRYMESLHTFFDHTGRFTYAVKAHTNGDPHGHVDTGSFIVYKGDAPVLIDPGLDCYSSFNWDYTKTKYRNAGWHNTVMFNGHSEAGGGRFAASEQTCDMDHATFSCELSGTFDPAAEVKRWTRHWQRDGERLLVTDEWNVGGKGLVELVLMLWDKPRILPEEHKIVLDAVGATITYDERFTPQVDLLEESGSLNNPAILKEHAERLDFYQIAPRLPYEQPTVIPFPSSLQWGQPYLYRVLLRTTAHTARCVTVIE